MPAIVDNLAHELGHLLGLSDQNRPECSRFIMSGARRREGGSYQPRFIQQSECSFVLSRWQQSREAKFAVEVASRPSTRLTGDFTGLNFRPNERLSP